jgi:hypothetical protein
VTATTRTTPGSPLAPSIRRRITARRAETSSLSKE